eukprot:CAMPEP_0198282106 /NCGR_PEP_ID=MMETSP1449-20131203/1945_1 /TAXON_ID=420275 /ORGANISM="Attheya septentrionalis, Strain CCMP2084" /LENGTH=568 /DNA_ID=CAMNT_0043978191 /DNA_START=420 /DNA_END=2126 /DNA_ORIENTATION=-
MPSPVETLSDPQVERRAEVRAENTYIIRRDCNNFFASNSGSDGSDIEVFKPWECKSFKCGASGQTKALSIEYTYNVYMNTTIAENEIDEMDLARLEGAMLSDVAQKTGLLDCSRGFRFQRLRSRGLEESNALIGIAKTITDETTGECEDDILLSSCYSMKGVITADVLESATEGKRMTITSEVKKYLEAGMGADEYTLDGIVSKVQWVEPITTTFEEPDGTDAVLAVPDPTTKSDSDGRNITNASMGITIGSCVLLFVLFGFVLRKRGKKDAENAHIELGDDGGDCHHETSMKSKTMLTAVESEELASEDGANFAVFPTSNTFYPPGLEVIRGDSSVEESQDDSLVFLSSDTGTEGDLSKTSSAALGLGAFPTSTSIRSYSDEDSSYTKNHPASENVSSSPSSRPEISITSSKSGEYSERAKALEHMIENDDWEGIVNTAGQYRQNDNGSFHECELAPGSFDTQETLYLSAKGSPTDFKSKSSFSLGGSPDINAANSSDVQDAIAKAKMWEAVAKGAASRNDTPESSNDGANMAAEWAISRHFKEMLTSGNKKEEEESPSSPESQKTV